MPRASICSRLLALSTASERRARCQVSLVRGQLRQCADEILCHSHKTKPIKKYENGRPTSVRRVSMHFVHLFVYFFCATVDVVSHRAENELRAQICFGSLSADHLIVNKSDFSRSAAARADIISGSMVNSEKRRAHVGYRNNRIGHKTRGSSARVADAPSARGSRSYSPRSRTPRVAECRAHASLSIGRMKKRHVCIT